MYIYIFNNDKGDVKHSDNGFLVLRGKPGGQAREEIWMD